MKETNHYLKIAAFAVLSGLAGFLSLALPEAAFLMPQGWLLIGVIRHILAWPILPYFIVIQAIFGASLSLAYRRTV